MHDYRFTAGIETCTGCDAAVCSVLYDVDPDEGMLEGDKERIAIANESRQDAQTLRAHAIPLLGGKGDEPKSDRRDAYKALELVAKLNRLAIDAVNPILERKHERGLAREAKRIKGVQ